MMLDARDIGLMLSIHPDTVRDRLSKRPGFPDATRVGRVLRWDRSDIEEWLDRQRVPNRLPSGAGSDAEWFWRRVNIKSPDQCWLFGGIRIGGRYGHLKIDGKSCRAHRVAYALHSGEPIPDGMWVLHTCDNPPCCNPAHLYLGQHKQNVDDRTRRNRMPCGERSTTAKITEAQAVAIIRSTATNDRLARKYRVNRATISRIRTGKRWAHLNDYRVAVGRKELP